jgi:hypothetical protein
MHALGGQIAAELAALGSGWQLKLTGWPWWIVLLLAVAGVWALVRLHRRELAALDAGGISGCAPLRSPSWFCF